MRRLAYLNSGKTEAQMDRKDKALFDGWLQFLEDIPKENANGEKQEHERINIQIPISTGVTEGEHKEEALRKFRSLDGYWLGSPDRDAPTVILFTGNNGLFADSAEFVRYYYPYRFNILMITPGGYPGSTPEIPTTELTSYQDAQAALEYARKRGGNNKIIAHGFSMGATSAIHAASIDPDVDLIIDRPFTTIEDVAVNIGLHITRGRLEKVIQSIVKRVLPYVFPIGETDGIHTTNGLNNLQKITKVKGSCLFLYATDDEMMTMRPKHPKKRTALDKTNFAHLLCDQYEASFKEAQTFMEKYDPYNSFFSLYSSGEVPPRRIFDIIPMRGTHGATFYNYRAMDLYLFELGHINGVHISQRMFNYAKDP